MDPILSIAVASYNVEKYLDKCLTSFCDERFCERLQVIVVNDGSTDRTKEIAEGYAKKYPKIFEVVNKENGGHGSAVNAGIERARGKYFRIVDGDDWVNTENMARLLDLMEAVDTDILVDNKREVNMVTGDTEFFPSPKNVVCGKVYAFTDVCNDEEITPNIMIHTMSIKTEILKNNAIRLLEGIFYVDIEFIIKATVHAKTVLFADLEIYQYLVGNVNQSVNYKNYVKRYSHHLQVTTELVSFATVFECDGALREYLDGRIVLLINTHLNIALIYNDDRKQGKADAEAFRRFLKKTNEKYYKATNRRYYLTLALHNLGVDYEKLQKIKGKN